jgi:hypothetical protein
MTLFQYRDPLIGVLDYIVEVRARGQCLFALIVISGPQKKSHEDTISEDTIAVAHDDDLKLIKDVVRPKSECWNLYLNSINDAPA